MSYELKIQYLSMKNMALKEIQKMIVKMFGKRFLKKKPIDPTSQKIVIDISFKEKWRSSGKRMEE